MPPALATLLRASGPASGGLCLSVFGVWGGQYAAMFIWPFQYIASAICIGAMACGVGVAAGGHGLRLPPFPEGTDQNLKDGIFNIVLIALGASALTVDETLDKVFGKASTDKDLTRIGIRVMVNQLRNAFAHILCEPSG